MIGEIYDKSIIYLPWQGGGIRAISWHSSDTLGHSFSKIECRTTVILRMTKIRKGFSQLSLKSVRKSLKGIGNKGYR